MNLLNAENYMGYYKFYANVPINNETKLNEYIDSIFDKPEPVEFDVTDRSTGKKVTRVVKPTFELKKQVFYQMMSKCSMGPPLSRLEGRQSQLIDNGYMGAYYKLPTKSIQLAVDLIFIGNTISPFCLEPYIKECIKDYPNTLFYNINKLYLGVDDEVKILIIDNKKSLIDYPMVTHYYYGTEFIIGPHSMWYKEPKRKSRNITFSRIGLSGVYQYDKKENCGGRPDLQPGYTVPDVEEVIESFKRAREH